MKKTKSYETDMTNGSLFKKMCFFSIPLIMTGVLQLLFNATDMIVVGRFAGPEALSAVGSTGALVNMIINIFIGLAVGGGVCISRYYGEKNAEKIDKTVHTAIALAILGGIFLAVFAFFIVEPLLVLMQTPTEVLPGAVLYMKIFFMGMPFNLIFNFGASMLRAVGDTKRPLRFLAAAGVVNVILNLILVIVFHMSVAGVAIATITAQAISSFLILRLLIKGGSVLKLDIRRIRIHKVQFLNIIKIGLPAGIQGSLFSISNVIVQSSINSFNSTIITAGNSASINLEGFMFVSTNSITQAAITAAGQNMGARDYKRVKSSAFLSCFMAAAVSFVMGMVFFTFADNFISLYDNTDPEIIRIGAQRLKYMSIFYVGCGLMDVLVGQLKGMGYYITPTIVSLCGVCLFRILWISTVFAKYNSLNTIYLVYPVSWILTAAMQFCILVFAIKKLPKEKPLPQTI